MKADIVVFDPATVASTATYAEPRSFPIGIDWVVVNGEIVVAVVSTRARRRDERCDEDARRRVLADRNA